MSERALLDQVGLRYGVASDVGLVRQVNEDSWLTEPPVFVVADGMGGHDGGEIASGIVVEEFARVAEAGYDARRGPDVVMAALLAARQRLLEYGATHRGRDGGPWHGGTTTVVALLVEDDDGPQWLLVNLGDSRIYRVVAGELRRVSTDHSVVQELVDAGQLTEDEARSHPERHIVTRAVGGPDPVEPDFFTLPLSQAQRVVLCSDGVTDLVADHALAEVLLAESDPRRAAERIVDLALAEGGIDNATAVVVDVVGLADAGSDGSGAEGLPRESEGSPDKLGDLP